MGKYSAHADTTKTTDEASLPLESAHKRTVLLSSERVDFEAASKQAIAERIHSVQK